MVVRKINVLDADLTATESDIGDATKCFDSNPSTILRSASINPAFAQAAFAAQQSVKQVRVLLGQPGFPDIDKNNWWLEAANSQDDLDRKTGSYQLVVPERFDVAGTWDTVILSESVEKKIWRFWIARTVSDNFVHIPELELWTEVSIPHGADLDVTYISREPRYEWDSAKAWPDVGEPVSFTAHIVNKGAMDSDPFEFEWIINDKVVVSGVAESIPPQGETTQEIAWEWAPGRHYIGFRADPHNLVDETSEANNVVEDVTDALPVAFWVEESVYSEFNSRENILGSYSWEDWARQIIEEMNWMFEHSKYPRAPDGIVTRVRLDKVTIVPDGTLFSLNSAHAPRETTSDGQWGFSVEEYLGAPAHWLGVPWVVIHELGHQMFGLVDLYGLDAQGIDVNVLGDDGAPISGTPVLPFVKFDILHYASRIYDLMHAPAPYAVFSDHSTYYINKYWNIGQRTHRSFGSYIYEIPNETKLRVLDANGMPLANVSVAVYQALGGDRASGPYSQNFDNVPDIVGITDSQGLFSLGSKPFPDPEPPRDPEQGHILYNVALVELRHPSGDTEYTWLEVVDLNLAYWRGDKDLYVHDLYFPAETSQLRLSANEMIFSTTQGSPNPVPQNIQVDVLGRDVPYWRVTLPEAPWLRTIPSPDIALGYGEYPSGPLTFIVDSSGLEPGTYITNVTVSVKNDNRVIDNPQTVTITLNIDDSGLPPEDLTVSIDIKPHDRGNVINPRSHGSIWVAVLSDTQIAFDPLQLDIPTVRFGPELAEAMRRKVKDVNKDGLGDLLLHFMIPETGIACGDTEATLTGKTFDGVSFTGTDSIKTVNCTPKKCHKKKNYQKHHHEKHHWMRHRKYHDDDCDDDEKHHGKHKEKRHHGDDRDSDRNKR
jgi:hypothetical protein